jgi:Rrf2 family iron-sulfur cluster assembly transcriptional regulator
MWLTSTAQHAIRAAVYLAEYAGDGPVPVADVARALQAPRNYLSKTLNALVNAGVLRSTRGPGGGFQLAIAPSQLSLARVSEPFAAVGAQRCLLGRSSCDGRNPCAVHARWAAASAPTLNFFRRITIADLLRVARKDSRRAVENDRGRRQPISRVPSTHSPRRRRSHESPRNRRAAGADSGNAEAVR